MTSADAYARTEILTASPHQLRSLMLKGALQAAHHLEQAVDNQDGERIVSCGTRLRALVLELIPPKSADIDPGLLAHMRSIGVYLYRCIGIACGRRDPAVAGEITRLLAFEQETWRQAVARLESGQSGGLPPGRTNLAG